MKIWVFSVLGIFRIGFIFSSVSSSLKISVIHGGIFEGGLSSPDKTGKLPYELVKIQN